MTPDRDAIAMLLQEFLAAREEDRARLTAPKCSGWTDAYLRALAYVCGKMQKRVDWREWIELRPQVIEIVKELIG